MALADAVAKAGVVGAGGAGFPTHVKAASKVEVVIANGAECEPVLVTDQWVMANHAGEVVEALRALGVETGARRVLIALKRKYTEVAARFQPLLKGEPKIELFLLDDFYPAGDEHVLVHEVTGRVVPEGGIPLAVGALVQNVSTLLNIHRAMHGQPVVSKHVTIAGEVRKPGVYVVPIGTYARDAIAAAGGARVESFRVIEGGPMMGSLLDDLGRPVTKTTAGYVLLDAKHPLVAVRQTGFSLEVRRTMSVCCGCRMCSDLCPRALLGHRIAPHRAMRAFHRGTEGAADVATMAFLCSLCGVCEAYACPMGLSPRRILGALKEGLASAKVQNPHHDQPKTAPDMQSWARVPKWRLTERLGLNSYLLPHVGSPETIAVPSEVCIPLKQHTGAPALATVGKGQQVREGDAIGEIPLGSLGARVHASITGVVAAVSPKHVVIARA